VFNPKKGFRRLALVAPLVAVAAAVCITIGYEPAVFPLVVLAFVLAAWVVATLYGVCRIVQWVIDGFWNPRIDGCGQEELDAHNALLKDGSFCIRDMAYDVSERRFTLWFKSVEGDQGKLVIRNVAGCDLRYACDAEAEHQLVGIAVDYREDAMTLWANDTFSVRLKLDPAVWDVTATCPAVCR
jgi:hypothetical protein